MASIQTVKGSLARGRAVRLRRAAHGQRDLPRAMLGICFVPNLSPWERSGTEQKVSPLSSVSWVHCLGSSRPSGEVLVNVLIFSVWITHCSGSTVFGRWVAQRHRQCPCLWLTMILWKSLSWANVCLWQTHRVFVWRWGDLNPQGENISKHEYLG